MAEKPTQEGWYPDPTTDNTLERFFDGEDWTKQVRWPKLKEEGHAAGIAPDFSSARTHDQIFKKPKEPEWVHPRVAAERAERLSNSNKHGHKKAHPGLQIPASRSWGTTNPEDLTKPLLNATFGAAVKRSWKLGFTFRGRATPSEYWWGYLGFFLVNLTICGAIFTIIPIYAAMFRRLHDTGRSGWYVLLPFLTVPLSLSTILFPQLVSTEAPLTSLLIFAAVNILVLIPSIIVLVMLIQPSRSAGDKYNL